MWPLFTTAILLGLISSFHCVGMCGPLVLSLPLSEASSRARAGALLAYHGGRMSVYACLGAVFGLLGRHIYLAGFQQAFSITLGVVIVVLAVVTACHKRLSWLSRLQQPLNKLIFRLWQSHGRYRYFILGTANGLLPCGMVYLALAGALSFPQVGQSILFMIIFGAGTLPALLLLGSTRRLAGARTRTVIRKWMPGVMAVMGVLLICRGLDLGIPFLSPVLAHGPAYPVSCH